MTDFGTHVEAFAREDNVRAYKWFSEEPENKYLTLSMKKQLDFQIVKGILILIHFLNYIINRNISETWFGLLTFVN